MGSLRPQGRRRRAPHDGHLLLTVGTTLRQATMRDDLAAERRL